MMLRVLVAKATRLPVGKVSRPVAAVYVPFVAVTVVPAGGTAPLSSTAKVCALAVAVLLPLFVDTIVYTAPTPAFTVLGATVITVATSASGESELITEAVLLPATLSLVLVLVLAVVVTLMVAVAVTGAVNTKLNALLAPLASAGSVPKSSTRVPEAYVMVLLG